MGTMLCFSVRSKHGCVTFSFLTKKTLKLHVIQSFPVKLKYKDYTNFWQRFHVFCRLNFLGLCQQRRLVSNFAFFNDSVIFVTVSRLWMIDVWRERGGLMPICWKFYHSSNTPIPSDMRPQSFLLLFLKKFYIYKIFYFYFTSSWNIVCFIFH